MSRFQWRGSIALVVVVVALLGPGFAVAQVGPGPGPYAGRGDLLNNLVTGAQYDIVNQEKAERRLFRLRGKLTQDIEQGNPAAVDRDVRRIDSLKYRIVVDEWLIRKNLLMEPGCYPYPLRMDPITCAAIGQYRRPPHAP